MFAHASMYNVRGMYRMYAIIKTFVEAEYKVLLLATEQIVENHVCLLQSQTGVGPA
jgi:hypothetical protein